MAKKKAAKSRANLRFVVTSQTAVADFFGVTRPAVNGWMHRGCPGRQGAFDLGEIARWLYAQPRFRHAVQDPGADEDAALLSGGSSDSPNLERMRAAKARMWELDLEEKERRSVDIETVKTCLQESGQMIRKAGEKLQRRFGAEAQRILDECLDEAEQAVLKLKSVDR